MDKIKTILAGIEGLIDRLPDETSFYSLGQRRAYELVKELIYQQFPELQESEDEKIRKEIIGYLNNRVATAEEIEILYFKRWIAYLEKQKVNTDGDFARGYDCGYECCLNSHGAEWFEKQKENKSALRVLPCSAAWFEDGEEKQKEQKSDVKDPFDDEQFRRGYEAGKHDAMREQKPEWSEEDDVMLKRVLETYTCYEADIRSKDVLSDNDIEVLHECAEEKIWLKGRFKSLRSSWKPSEEQIYALKYELGEGGIYNKEALKSLLDDLEKQI